MNYIDKLRQKLEQIERKIKSIYRIAKRKSKYILINILKFLALRLFGIVIYVFCMIMNLPFDSIIKKFIDGSIHVGKVFEWLKDFIVNIDFKSIFSFLRSIPSNFRQIITNLLTFMYERFRDLKRIVLVLYKTKYIIAKIKSFIVENLSCIKRIMQSAVGAICSIVFTKAGMFLIPFLGIQIIFAGKDISIVVTLILCGIFSLIGTQIGKLIGGKSSSYFLLKFHKKKYNR